MKKYIPTLAFSLLICLFIYVFYRTEKTLINQIIIAIFSEETYLLFKRSITTVLPLKECLIYSLPEGLWIFCITVTSSFFYLEIGARKLNLAFVPIVVAVVMELFQLVHFINGRFDMMDINFSVGFWLLASFWTVNNSGIYPLFKSFNTKTTCCIFTYSIVYLAHVAY